MMKMSDPYTRAEILAAAKAVAQNRVCKDGALSPAAARIVERSQFSREELRHAMAKAWQDYMQQAR